jgi:hypothetical protein
VLNLNITEENNRFINEFRTLNLHLVIQVTVEAKQIPNKDVVFADVLVNNNMMKRPFKSEGMNFVHAILTYSGKEFGTPPRELNNVACKAWNAINKFLTAVKNARENNQNLDEVIYNENKQEEDEIAEAFRRYVMSLKQFPVFGERCSHKMTVEESDGKKKIKRSFCPEGDDCHLMDWNCVCNHRIQNKCYMQRKDGKFLIVGSKCQYKGTGLKVKTSSSRNTVWGWCEDDDECKIVSGISNPKETVDYMYLNDDIDLDECMFIENLGKRRNLSNEELLQRTVIRRKIVEKFVGNVPKHFDTLIEAMENNLYGHCGICKVVGYYEDNSSSLCLKCNKTFSKCEHCYSYTTNWPGCVKCLSNINRPCSFCGDITCLTFSETIPVSRYRQGFPEKPVTCINCLKGLTRKMTCEGCGSSYRVKESETWKKKCLSCYKNETSERFKRRRGNFYFQWGSVPGNNETRNQDNKKQKTSLEGPSFW